MLGAKPSFWCEGRHPAALPHVFVGLFMGLGSSFALVVAEMIGVKAVWLVSAVAGVGLFEHVRR